MRSSEFIALLESEDEIENIDRVAGEKGSCSIGAFKRDVYGESLFFPDGLGR